MAIPDAHVVISILAPLLNDKKYDSNHFMGFSYFLPLITRIGSGTVLMLLGLRLVVAQ